MSLSMRLIPKSRKFLPEDGGVRGLENALRVFHDAAARVPAYSHFLRKNGIEHTRISNYEDFSKIPHVT